MDKNGFVEAFSRKTGMTKVISESMVAAACSIITEALVKGDKVQIVGFGTFEVKERAPRTGRNPKKNVPVYIPAKKVPYFKPGKGLKTAVERSIPIKIQK